MKKTFTTFKTNFGWIGLEKSANHITLITFPVDSNADCENSILSISKNSKRCDHHFSNIKEKISLYLSGQKVDFSSIHLDYSAHTPFSKKTLEACRKIPSGETRSYKWLAKNAGSPLAYRAIGQIMAKNKFPIIIPCHRIVGSNGKLTGFRGEMHDIAMKMKFLDLENNLKHKALN